MTEHERSDVFVQFGASGDLARKMTFASLYMLAKAGRLDMPVIGVALDDWTDDGYRRAARAAIASTIGDVDENVWRKLSAAMTYVCGDYSQPEVYDAVKERLADRGSKRPLVYLEIPPSLFGTVVNGCHIAGISDGARFIIEKPFGRDLRSAVDLKNALYRLIDEDQIFRIDHYLGKNAVEDIMLWRFANRMIDPVWRGSHIDHVQIMKLESLDVADRGSFYDPVGALRDVVQNHMLQILALLAMEPPTRDSSPMIHAEQLKVFDALRVPSPGDYVRGQYRGYRDVEGVASDSQTETFAALKLHVDSWRWSGTPFLLRTGKCMPVDVTEVAVRFRQPPLQLFGSARREEPRANLVRIKISPTSGIDMELRVKDVGRDFKSRVIKFGTDFDEQIGRELLPYELLLGEAIEGNRTLFATQDMVEGAWRAMQPLLDGPGPVHTYEPGTMGPPEAEALAADHGGWIDPSPERWWGDVMGG